MAWWLGGKGATALIASEYEDYQNGNRKHKGAALVKLSLIPKSDNAKRIQMRPTFPPNGQSPLTAVAALALKNLREAGLGF